MDELEATFTRKDMTFEEAVNYFKGRVPVTADVFYSIAEQYRGLAFTVSGYTKAQVLKKFYDELLAALEEGNTLGAFRTNIQTAYNVGHYEQMTDPAVVKLRPFWQYDAVNDRHTRPSHLAMDGKVYPADHPVWDVWFPPNGFRCRCTVRTLSKRQVERQGLKVENSFPALAPDPHFGTNAAKVQFSPDLKGYPAPLVKAYKRREAENPVRTP